MAKITANSTDSPKEFARSFGGRIAATARAHEALATERWEGIQLPTLIDLALRPFSDGGRRVKMEGSDTMMSAGSAQPLALAIHKLATNAARHGALAAENGCVEVTWAHRDRRHLTLDWIEKNGPRVSVPSKIGPGRDLVSGIHQERTWW